MEDAFFAAGGGEVSLDDDPTKIPTGISTRHIPNQHTRTLINTHTNTQHNTPQHNTTQHNTTQHNTMNRALLLSAHTVFVLHGLYPSAGDA